MALEQAERVCRGCNAILSTRLRVNIVTHDRKTFKVYHFFVCVLINTEFKLDSARHPAGEQITFPLSTLSTPSRKFTYRQGRTSDERRLCAAVKHGGLSGLHLVFSPFFK